MPNSTTDDVVRLHVHLPRAVSDELRARSIAADRPLSREVRRAITEYLDRHREAKPG
jgi:hypothetical protein